MIRKKIARLLELLLVPAKPWASVSLDIITHLPKVEEFEAILVIVDRFSKYVMFVPTSKTCLAEMITQLSNNPYFLNTIILTIMQKRK